MENVLDLMYQIFTVVIFCMAISVLILLYSNYTQVIDEAKHDLYYQHAIMQQ